MKKMIRMICSTVTSGVALLGMLSIGKNIGVLNTNFYINITMVLGIILILCFNLQTLMENPKLN